MTDDNPNQPTQNTAGGNIHQDHRRYKSQRDMYVAEGDINIHPPKQEVSYPFYDIRHAQNPNFTGREDVLAELHTQLHQQQTTTVTQTIAGLGGVGKTQLVVEYAHRCKADYDIVAWLGADSELLLGNDVVMLGQALQLVQPPVTDQNAAIQTVRRWLGSTGKRWLLLVDNADTLPPRTVPSCLPTTGSGHILITSRNPNWGSVGAVLRLDVFTPAEAKAFLQRRLGNVDAAECAALAQTLGCFPLAMEHAAAFIEEKQCGVAAYHTYFTEQRQQLWATLEPPNAYHATITTTWELAFQEIKKTAGAAEVLNLCAFLDADAIPLTLLQAAELTDNALTLDEAIAALRRYSLLERNGGMLTMHRMVQMVVRDQMGAERAQEWVETAMETLIKVLPDRKRLHEWANGAVILAHMIATSDYVNEIGLETERLALLCNQTGYYLQFRGEYKAARPYYERALAIYKKVLAKNHPDTATCLNNMGALLQAMGALAEARPYYERALTIREQVLGKNHPDTAATLNNMGALLHTMGELAAARPYYVCALTIYKKVLGKNHPDTAATLNNMGALSRAMGKLAKARSYYKRALTIREQVLGENHPDTAASLNNIGALLRAMGELAEARPYLEHALTIREQVLGENHPATAQSIWWMGILAEEDGNFVEAKSYYQRAYNIFLRALGPEHPNTKNVQGFLNRIEAKLS